MATTQTPVSMFVDLAYYSVQFPARVTSTCGNAA